MESMIEVIKGNYIDIDGVWNVYKSRKNGEPAIHVRTKRYSGHHYFVFDTEQLRDDALNRILTTIKQKRGTKMEKPTITDHLKDYIERHRDTFFTLLVIIVIDHLFLHGALREKVKTTTEGLLNRMLPPQALENNNGTKSGTIVIEFQDNGTSIENKTVNIQNNSVFSTWFNWTAPTYSFHNFTFIIDPDNLISEYYENNNQLSNWQKL